jgi:hypothetical protein
MIGAKVTLTRMGFYVQLHNQDFIHQNQGDIRGDGLDCVRLLNKFVRLQDLCDFHRQIVSSQVWGCQEINKEFGRRVLEVCVNIGKVSVDFTLTFVSSKDSMYMSRRAISKSKFVCAGLCQLFIGG